jgi:hypothetical protein
MERNRPEPAGGVRWTRYPGKYQQTWTKPPGRLLACGWRVGTSAALRLSCAGPLVGLKVARVLGQIDRRYGS